MRLTKTFRNGEVHTLRTCCARYYMKLSQLEDLEDDLKLSLDIFIKALLNGVYFKDNKNEIKHSKVKFIAKEKCFALIDKNNKSRGDIRFNNYGKTWTLTKEELL